MWAEAEVNAEAARALAAAAVWGAAPGVGGIGPADFAELPLARLGIAPCSAPCTPRLGAHRTGAGAALNSSSSSNNSSGGGGGNGGGNGGNGNGGAATSGAAVALSSMRPGAVVSVVRRRSSSLGSALDSGGCGVRVDLGLTPCPGTCDGCCCCCGGGGLQQHLPPPPPQRPQSSPPAHSSRARPPSRKARERAQFGLAVAAGGRGRPTTPQLERRTTAAWEEGEKGRCAVRVLTSAHLAA